MSACRIVHLALDGAAAESVRARPPIYGVGWRDGVPLAHVFIDEAEEPMDTAALRERLRRAAEAAARAPLPDGAEPVSDHASAPACAVSVIVCTRDRPRSLLACLEALHEALAPRDEIVVVDNAPTGAGCAAVVAAFPDVVYVRERTGGLSIARNGGIRHARHPLIAFTDDDVTVHPRWLERLRAGFADPSVSAVTGCVLPAELETRAQLEFELSGTFGFGYRPCLYAGAFLDRHRARGVPVWRIGAGASMAFRRELFERLGGFDERLGAGAAGCSEDSELWYRVLAAGGVCRYEPGAVVFHTHRREGRELRSQMRHYMRGHVAALLVQLFRHGDIGNLRHLTLTLPWHYARLPFRGDARARRQRGTWLAQVDGCLRGVFAYAAQSLRGRGAPPIAAVDNDRHPPGHPP